MRRRIVHISLVTLLVGCGDDGLAVDPGATTGGGGETTTFGSGDGDGDETADDGGGGACAEYPLPFPMGGVFTPYRENNGAAVVADIDTQQEHDTFCPNAPALAGGTSSFYVYRPTSGGGSWPGDSEQQFPLVVFSPPNGGNTVSGSGEHLYPWFDRLAAEGFIVVAIDASPGQFISERYAFAACAIDWARTQWAHADRVNCDVALIGHSRGGGAVHNLVEPLVLGGGGLRAVVGIAPAQTSGLSGDEAEPVDPSLTVPYFVLGGGNDEDVFGHFSLLFDMMGPEDPPGTLSRSDKAGFYLYDAPHFVYGGKDPALLGQAYNDVNIARGRAVAGAYVSRFLRWHVYGEHAQRHWFVAPTEPNATATAFPAEILEAEIDEEVVDLWAELYEQTPYSVLEKRPVMLPMFSQGVDPVGPGAPLLPERHRLPIDTMYRSPTLDCEDEDQPDILSPSSPLQAEVLGVGLAGADVCVATSDNQALPDHDTHGMQLDWGQASYEDGIRWELFEDLEPYSTLSLRMGKRFVGGGTTAPLSVRLEIETEAMDDDGTFPLSSSVDYDRVLNPDLSSYPSPGVTMMHSVRVPLESFMSPTPIDLSAPRAISLLAPSTQTTAFLHVDSLEVTRHPVDTPAMAPPPGAYWACQADTRLTVVETSCREAPNSGSCPAQSEVTTPLDLPHVSIGAGWDGWLVDTIPGWVADPDNPTGTELQSLARRCQTACERHYQGYPVEVVAACDDSSFITPYRVTATESRTRRAIPDARRDASGLIGSESLSCDLLDSCWCDAFVSPDTCAAAPMRVTTAQSQLGRAEQWVLDVAGAVTAESVDDEASGAAALVGQVGFSRCDGWSGTTACPYHLGSAHFETTEGLELEIECDGQPVVFTVDSLEVDLVQPAAGIDDNGFIAFPRGALVMRTVASVGQAVFEDEGPNEADVVFSTGAMFGSESWEHEIEVTLGVWCGGEIKPVTAQLGFDVTGTVDSPPSVTIDVDDWVSCPVTIDLEDDVTVTDPDTDVDTVRWRIHDHLMAPSVDDVLVQGKAGAIDLEVVACDARGGCTRAEKTAQCIPVFGP